VAVTEKLFTAEELAGLRLPPQGGKYELIRGRVLYVSPPFQDHGSVQGLTFAGIERFATLHDLGIVSNDSGFKLAVNPDVVVAPDVSFTSWQRLGQRRALRGYVPGPPDLAVEVKSSDDTEPEVLAKVALYLEFGTPRVWVARPVQRTVTVHWLDGAVRVFGEGDALTGEEAGFAVAGFSLSVADIFRFV
jgi:Uma2 family endonuclease